MILFLFILVLVLGAFLAWLSAAWNKKLPRWIALMVLVFELAMAAAFWAGAGGDAG